MKIIITTTIFYEYKVFGIPYFMEYMQFLLICVSVYVLEK